MSENELFAARVDDVLELRRKFFPDLFFQLDPSEPPLRIALPESPIRKVRLELTQPGLLHLGSIAFVGENLTSHEILAGAELTLSSIYPDGEESVRAKRFFEAGYDGVGLHTNAEDAPWAQVTLAKPYALKEMLLHNRRGKHAVRAWALRILVQNEDYTWRAVYDHGARRAEFNRVLSTSLAAAPSARRTELEVLDRYVLAALGGEFEGMKKDLRAEPGADKAAKAEMRRIINEKILLSRGVEWTTHGVTRSFRFWSNKEKVAYLREANALVEVLRELSPDVCLGFGSVLSIVRDHDLIPHDDDLDIIVAMPQSQASKISMGLALVSQHLKARGYKSTGKYKSHRHVSLGGSKVIDVFVGLYEEGDKISWFPGPRGNLVRDDVFPPISAKLLGVSCAIPRNPFVYLERIYGSGWAVPTPRWNHKWDRSAFADLF